MALCSRATWALPVTLAAPASAPAGCCSLVPAYRHSTAPTGCPGTGTGTRPLAGDLISPEGRPGGGRCGAQAGSRAPVTEPGAGAEGPGAWAGAVQPAT